MSSIIADIGLNSIRRITDLLRSGRANSLVEYTQPTRVESVVMVDNAVLFLDYTPDLMQSLQTIFSGFYLQAVALSCDVGNISIIRSLDKLNPRRSPLDSAANTAGMLLAAESYKFGLPMLSLEAKDAIKDDVSTELSISAGRDTTKDLRELADLSVGKVLSVEITDGVSKRLIPISIRLIASSMPSQTIVHILSQGSEDTGAVERWHGLRSGRLEFAADILMCRDLVSAHKKALIKDKSGVYENIIKRRRSNQLSAILSLSPSVASMSNMALIAKTTADELELAIGGRLKDPKVRDRMFEQTSLMLLAVVSPDYERVTIYHHSIPEATDVSIRDIRAANKKGGSDVSEIMKAYINNQAPRF